MAQILGILNVQHGQHRQSWQVCLQAQLSPLPITTYIQPNIICLELDKHLGVILKAIGLFTVHRNLHAYISADKVHCFSPHPRIFILKVANRCTIHQTRDIMCNYHWNFLSPLKVWKSNILHIVPQRQSCPFCTLLATDTTSRPLRF